jgi:predicted metal-dependent hydrolase
VPLFRKSSRLNSSTTIFDDEFGAIKVRRSRTKYVRIRVEPTGHIVASMPIYASLGSVRLLIDSSRLSLRKSLANLPKKRTFESGEIIGKSHRLVLASGPANSTRLRGQEIQVTLRPDVSDQQKADLIREAVARALRREAKAYLPRRLGHLAERHGFKYQTIRFSHAKSRWGSCSSRGTISLNIALMLLPNELIDYVLLHELAHTEQMNHSAKFWQRLESVCPEARTHRKSIAKYSPFL